MNQPEIRISFTTVNMAGKLKVRIENIILPRIMQKTSAKEEMLYLLPWKDCYMTEQKMKQRCQAAINFWKAVTSITPRIKLIEI